MNFFLSFFLFFILNFNKCFADPITFTKEAYADWTLPENQDRITDGVWITRKDNQGLFNIFVEENYSGQSPLNTLWAPMKTMDASQEDFTSWVVMHNSDPQSTIDDTVSLHIPEVGLYFDLVLISFSGGNSGGGFSYAREQIYPQHLTNDDNFDIQQSFSLKQNYPNPFNPSTTLNYNIEKDSFVKVVIHDLNGIKVRTLVNEFQTSGNKNIVWDGTDIDGNAVSTGIYFYSLTNGARVKTKKMSFVK